MRPFCWAGAGPKVQRPPACVLCPVTGPPLRRTSCGRFCHVGCAQWLGETFIQGGLVHGLRHVSKVTTPHLRHPHCLLLFVVIHSPPWIASLGKSVLICILVWIPPLALRIATKALKSVCVCVLKSALAAWHLT